MDNTYISRTPQNVNERLGMVTQAFNPSTWEGEIGQSLSLRLAWFIQQVPSEPILYSESLSQTTTKNVNEVLTVKITVNCSHLVKPLKLQLCDFPW